MQEKRQKKEMELMKGKRISLPEKVKREQYVVASKESNKTFGLALRAKRCTEIGQNVHNALKNKIPILAGSFIGRYYGFPPPQCCLNRVVAIEQLRI